METTTRWTSKQLTDLMDLAESGQCDKKCKTCPLFLPNRNECWIVFNTKWEKWNKKNHQRFQQYMKEYKG